MRWMSKPQVTLFLAFSPQQANILFAINSE
jgi:hypothetical protein